jgi:multiple sugar transport system permease protein
MSSTATPVQRGPASSGLLAAYVRPPGHRGRALRTRLAPYAFVSPTAVLMIILILIPVVMVIYYSVMDNVIVNKHPALVRFDNYAEVLTSPAFFTAIQNTAFFTGVSVVAHLVIGLTFAMLLNTDLLGRRLRALFRLIYILPWLFTVAIIAVVWRLLLNPNGIVNYLLSSAGLADGDIEWLSDPAKALFAVTFINIWAGYPFFMMSLLAGLQGIPGVLYEAAMVDGASGVRRFVHITLPQLKPIIVAMVVLDILWTTQQFALIWMTTGGGPLDKTEMLSTYTYKWAFSRYEYSIASASAVVILLLSLVLAVFYVRQQKARD